jgi:hypothetical protein
MVQKDDELMPLAAAFRSVTGRSFGRTTMNRWTKERNRSGRILEAVVVGNCFMTSRSAVIRYLTTSTAASGIASGAEWHVH